MRRAEKVYGPFVKFPMMPKGVEHYGVAKPPRKKVTVKFPMMPKGVEHIIPHLSQFGAIYGEVSNDAERR